MNILDVLPSDIIKTNEPMSNHTSFKIGGKADYFITPNNINELKAVIEACKQNGIYYYIIGNGSNLLVGDKGFKGAIIQIYTNMNSFLVTETTIKAEAGIMLSKLANVALDNNLTGLEFASGIPGTLGGAVSMNAGAYGGEMKQIINKCTVINENGEIYELCNQELEFNYRKSIISKSNLIVLNAEIGLNYGDYNKIKSYMSDLNQRRKTKQPLEFPSAGSVFKRPYNNFAGKLIMDAGLKGFSIGGAQISEKHCGFIINKDNAKAQDVLDLIKYIQQVVNQKFNIWLETEIKFIGIF